MSSVGDGILLTAAPLLTADLTSDPTAVAGVYVAGLLPWLLFALVAGVVVDRVQRKRLMRLVDVLRAGLLGVTAVVTGADSLTLWMLYGTVFLLGAGRTLFDSASQALLPKLVEDRDLERTNGRLLALQSAGAAFVGPALGGVLYAWHPAAPFAVDAVSFAVSAALLLFVRESAAPRTGVAEAPGVVADIVTGLRAIGRQPALAHMVVLVVFINIGNGMANGVMVLLGTQTLALSAQEYGLLLTGEAVGGVLAAPFAGRIRQLLGTGPALRAAGAAVAVSQVILGLTRDAVSAGAMLALGGVGFAVWTAIAVSFRQRAVPAELRGRVASTFLLASLGFQAMGMLLGGVLAQVSEVPVPVVVGGVLAGVLVALPGPLWRARSAEERAG